MENIVTRNVTGETVATGLCVGCGVCVGVCPSHNRQMTLNEFGEYHPTQELCSREGCTLCRSVCPVSTDSGPPRLLTQELYGQAAGVSYGVETGYFLDAFVGYRRDEELRLESASGGLLTALLEMLIETGRVDAVITVSPNVDTIPLFSFRVCKTIEDVRSCSRSCYYPVEASGVIRYMLENDGRYAVVGLPCLCRAIRLAQRRSRKLRERILHVLGLVCGQGKAASFLEYVVGLGGGSPHHIHSARFRVKSSTRPASDFGLSFETTINGSTKSGVVFWTEGMDEAWCQRYFTIPGCNYCTDVFAECADAAFMDAWLPGYRDNWRGHSLVLVRDQDVRKCLLESSHMIIEPVGIEDTVRSQHCVVNIKQRLLPWCVTPSPLLHDEHANATRNRPGLVERVHGRMMLKRCQVSRWLWLNLNKDVPRFRKRMKHITQRQHAILKVLKTLEWVKERIERSIKIAMRK